MKIRTDYVTNSSSSSFVIAFKDCEFDEDTLKKYPFLKTYKDIVKKVLTSENYPDEEALAINSPEEYREWFKKEYCYDYRINGYRSISYIIKDDEYLRKKFDNAMDKLVAGYSLILKTVENYNDAMINIIRGIPDGENFIMLEDDSL